ncbi:DUF5683 domain-containing protein [uncultured Winogradskyella sp.]|uniref:DUF5683 domain-containing protein n=1 Tax=uncultured Winogradskyella sp. TaxID=395353 RepID=UPI002603B4AE|nr:DUF5683 domain-containing protein [uncultured Winogradskyella sp.]
MLNKQYFFTSLFLCTFFFSFSQKTKNDSISLGLDKELKVLEQSVKRGPIDPLKPSKAAFYSAILPGAGQAYNKKYWKIPIVWGAIGTGVYFYTRNNSEFNRYRDAYKRRLAGFTDDEFSDSNGNALISDDGLIRAQQQFRRNKELSLLITVGLYALNIIDANVDAHLLQFNVDENLSLRPHYQYNQRENSSDIGLTFNFKF